MRNRISHINHVYLIYTKRVYTSDLVWPLPISMVYSSCILTDWQLHVLANVSFQSQTNIDGWLIRWTYGSIRNPVYSAKASPPRKGQLWHWINKAKDWLRYTEIRKHQLGHWQLPSGTTLCAAWLSVVPYRNLRHHRFFFLLDVCMNHNCPLSYKKHDFIQMKSTKRKPWMIELHSNRMNRWNTFWKIAWCHLFSLQRLSIYNRIGEEGWQVGSAQQPQRSSLVVWEWQFSKP